MGLPLNGNRNQHKEVGHATSWDWWWEWLRSSSIRLMPVTSANQLEWSAEESDIRSYANVVRPLVSPCLKYPADDLLGFERLIGLVWQKSRCHSSLSRRERLSDLPFLIYGLSKLSSPCYSDSKPCYGRFCKWRDSGFAGAEQWHP